MSLAHAWDWSKRRSPLARLTRFALRRPGEVEHLVASADLPGPCAELVRSVVRRTRLWPGEKADVARELIDHVHDALAAEQPPERVVEQFGDPGVAAKLIRRARRRQRHPIVRSFGIAKRGLGVAALLLIVGYAGLTTRFLLVEPTIKTNYIAIMSQGRPDPASLEVDGLLPHQHYNAARIVWNDFIADQQQIIDAAADESGRAPTAAADPRKVATHHPEYAQIEAKVRTLGPLLDQVARAAALADHGTPYTAEVTPSDADRSQPIADRLDTFARMPDDPAEQPPLYAILLPHLGDMRLCSMLLGFDARLAIEDSRPAAAVLRWFAMLDLAQQAQTDGYLISSVVALSMHDATMNEIKQGLAEHSQLFSREQITEIAHRVARSRSSTLYVDSRMERMMLDDVLQRTFTDDGKGNGTITLAGLSMIERLRNPGSESKSAIQLAWDETGESALLFASLPASPALVADRRTQRQIMVEFYDRFEAATKRKPHENLSDSSRNDRFDAAFSDLDDPFAELRYIIPRTFMPATGKAVNSLHLSRTNLDATLVALATESYRRDHGNFPASIDQLVPRYLPAVPDDPFNPGKPLLYRLDSGHAMVYSVGENGVDDGGIPTFSQSGEAVNHRLWARYGNSPPYDGDWILYPPAD